MLTPALMHLLGRLNWWAPQPLARLHSHHGARRPLTIFALLTTWLDGRHQ
jgi:uncharacterized membrane protein YdfJ with MMPL/SSD domain